MSRKKKTLGGKLTRAQFAEIGRIGVKTYEGAPPHVQQFFNELGALLLKHGFLSKDVITSRSWTERRSKKDLLALNEHYRNGTRPEWPEAHPKPIPKPKSQSRSETSRRVANEYWARVRNEKAQKKAKQKAAGQKAAETRRRNRAANSNQGT